MMRVLDLSDVPAGAFAAALLADLGAEVIKVEPPLGSPERRRDLDDPEDEGFCYANRRKQGVTLDITRRAGRELLLKLVAQSDAVVETFKPGTLERLRLSFRTMRRANPKIVLASVTPFGQSGPYRDWEGSELVLQAMGGIVSATGWEDTPPLRLAGHQAEYIAGINAATAVLAARFGVQTGATPAVHLDIAAYETFAPHWARHISQYAYSGTGLRRQIRANGRQGFPDTATAADGLLYLLALRASWEEMALFLGLEQFLGDEWSEAAERTRRWAEIDPHFRAAVAGRSKHDWFAAASAQGFTFAPLDGPSEILESPQLAARGFYDARYIDQDGSTVPCPRLPFIADFEPAGANRAPARGEHNQTVFGGLLGLSDEEMTALQDSGVVGGSEDGPFTCPGAHERRDRPHAR